jgi:hypothetical protein
MNYGPQASKVWETLLLYNIPGVKYYHLDVCQLRTETKYFLSLLFPDCEMGNVPFDALLFDLPGGPVLPSPLNPDPDCCHSWAFISTHVECKVQIFDQGKKTHRLKVFILFLGRIQKNVNN